MLNFKLQTIMLYFFLPAVALSEWTIVSPVTHANLNAIVWKDSQYVIAGDSGTVLLSNDGLNWIQQTTGIQKNLRAIGWNDTLLIVGGDSGMAVASIKHGPWEAKRIGDSLDILVITVGPNNTIVRTWNTSTYRYGTWDGTWKYNTSGFPVIGCKWVGNEFLCVGKGNYMLSSPDGINWLMDPFGDIYQLTSMAFENQTTIFGPEKNGGAIEKIVWNEFSWYASKYCSLPPTLYKRTVNAVDIRNGNRIAVGDTGLAFRFEKKDSMVVESIPTKRNLRGIAIGDSSAVIVGDSGLILINRVMKTAAKYSYTFVKNMRPLFPV